MQEMGWVIESLETVPTRYWWGTSAAGMMHWCQTVDEAIRFARKHDAEAFIRGMAFHHVRAVEHMWVVPSEGDGA